jgi:T5SS/PEP-CTERM-associated repeat protein/autotransporter-associated beta strand protein
MPLIRKFPLARALLAALLAASALPALAQNINATGDVSDGMTLIFGPQTSPWTLADSLEVGITNDGQVDITAGGVVNVGSSHFVVMGGNAATTGTVTVDGGGSALNNAGGAIMVGQNSGAGVLNISNGASVNTKDVWIAQQTTSAGTINIGGASAAMAAPPGALTVTGALTLGPGNSVLNNILNFNHTSDNYVFAPSINSAGDGGLVNAERGATILTGANTYKGITNIMAGAMLQAGSASAISPNAELRGYGILYLARHSSTIASQGAGSMLLLLDGGETLTVTGSFDSLSAMNVDFTSPAACTTAGTLLAITNSATDGWFGLASGAQTIPPGGMTCVVARGAGGAQPATNWYLIAVPGISIDSAAVTGITAPVTGNTPSGAATVPSGSHYTAGAVTWSPTDDPFAPGTVYTATITLTADADYTFVGLTSVTVNGNTPTHSLIYQDGRMVVSYAFPPTAAATTAITSADVSGITAPVTGGTPSDAATVPAGSHYTASAVTWSPTDDPFAAGTVYTATVTLTADSGYTFTGFAATAASIDGNAATIVSNTGDALTLSCQFPATAATPITAAAVTLSAPRAGDAPASTASVTSGSHYAAGAVTWSPTDDPFVAGTGYTATVTLTADAGYTFTGLAATDASIDGKPASTVNISAAGDAVTLTYVFPPLAPRVTGGGDAASVPTLGETALALLALVLAGGGAVTMRRGRK